MNVLLTGSAGFIGSHIAEALTAAGHRVRGLDLRPDGLGGGPADVRDPAEVARRLEGVDAVCHQAAKVGLGVDVSDLPDYTSVNVRAPPSCWRRWRAPASASWSWRPRW